MFTISICNRLNEGKMHNTLQHKPYNEIFFNSHFISELSKYNMKVPHCIEALFTTVVKLLLSDA